MTMESLARIVRKMRDAQRAREERATAVAAARCEGYEAVVDEMVTEVLGGGTEAASHARPMPATDEAADWALAKS